MESVEVGSEVLHLLNLVTQGRGRRIDEMKKTRSATLRSVQDVVSRTEQSPKPRAYKNVTRKNRADEGKCLNFGHNPVAGIFGATVPCMKNRDLRSAGEG